MRWGAARDSGVCALRKDFQGMCEGVIEKLDGLEINKVAHRVRQLPYAVARHVQVLQVLHVTDGRGQHAEFVVCDADGGD